VDALHTPYVFPQECGGRVGVRWLHLAPPAGGGGGDAAASQQPTLLIAAAADAAAAAAGGGGVDSCQHAQQQQQQQRGLQMSISRFSWQALTAARHQHELQSGDSVQQHLHLHLDCAHMGVGGDDSWSPSVHEAYMVPPAQYRLALVLQAVPAGCRGHALAAAAQRLRRLAT
jgi:beta-galactosidase